MNKHENKSKKRKWLIGGSLIFSIILALSLYSIQQNSVYFYTPKEAQEKSRNLHQNEIRVGGMVQMNSIIWQPKKLSVDFTLTDLKGVKIEVSYKGAPPDMFKEGSGVVVEGYINESGTKISAKNLLVKHSEEYRVPGDEGHSNHVLLEKSIIKNERP